MGVRVILQAEEVSERLGIIFDDDGVRGISVRDIDDLALGKPCCLLVSADGPWTSPLEDLDFCSAAIVVTSPNLKAKSGLNAWRKQVGAKQFVATPPSCLDVVYLLCGKFFDYH